MVIAGTRLALGHWVRPALLVAFLAALTSSARAQPAAPAASPPVAAASLPVASAPPAASPPVAPASPAASPPVAAASAVPEATTTAVEQREPTTAWPPRAPLDPLWQAEVFLGYGLAMSGSGTAMSKRPTPLTLSAVVGFAFNAEPPLFGYGGLVVELLDRSAIGGVFGIKYAPRGSRMHLAGGGSVLLAPDSLLGATARGGMCRRQRPALGLCADVELTAYFAGGDLAPGRAVTQIQLVLGAVFDVL